MSFTSKQLNESPYSPEDSHRSYIQELLVDRDSNKSEKKRREFREELKQGLWLQLSEKYLSRGSWTPERIARDVWQNFHDANGFNLDAVQFEIEEDAEGVIINISLDDVDYDFTRLLALGVGHKDDYNRSAGGEGEGTRMFALQMLRDLDFTEVVFASADWELEFYLDHAPEGRVPLDHANLRYLHAKLTDKEYEAGNYIRFRSTNKDIAKTFSDARGLFRHSENSDFDKPDIDNQKAGFKYNPNMMGNFYLNGQRISYNEHDKWNNIEGFTFWANSTPIYNEQTMHIGRDRRTISYKEMTEIYLPFLVDSMDQEELILTLEVLEGLYKYKPYESSIGDKFLELVVDCLYENGYRNHDFDSRLLAYDMDYDQNHIRLFENGGAIICKGCLAKIGMRKASEEFKRWCNVNLLERESLNEGAQRRMELLEGFVSDFLEETKDGVYVLRAKPLALFENNNLINGKAGEEFAYLNVDLIYNNSVAGALTTYFHEICHDHGPDNSAEFSYALTSLLRRKIQYIIKNPHALVELDKQWEGVKVEKDEKARVVWSIEDVRIVVERIPVSIKTILFREGYYDNFKKLLDSMRQEGVVSNTEVLIDLYKSLDDHPAVKRLEYINSLPSSRDENMSNEALEKELNKINRMREEKYVSLAELNKKGEEILDKTNASKKGRGARKLKPKDRLKLEELKEEKEKITEGLRQLEEAHNPIYEELIRTSYKFAHSAHQDARYEVEVVNVRGIDNINLDELRSFKVFFAFSLRYILDLYRDGEIDDKQLRSDVFGMFNYSLEFSDSSIQYCIPYELNNIDTNLLYADKDDSEFLRKLLFCASVLGDIYKNKM